MKTAAASPFNHAALSALITSLLTWLIALAAWLSEYVSEDWPLARDLKLMIRAELRVAARRVKNLVFVHACRHFDGRRARARPRFKAMHPASVPPGFRRVLPRDSKMRRHTKGIVRNLHGGALKQRAARLRELLDHIEKYALRLARRIMNGLAGARLAPIAPPAVMLAADCAPARVAAPDSS